MPQSLLILILTVFSLSALPQNKKIPSTDPGDDWADALVKWDTDCMAGGCILETDILRGDPDSDNPPDPKDVREYISIYVAVGRETRKPAYFAFHVDPRAQQNDGV